MERHRSAWILITAALLYTAFPSLALAEERFGPWAYFAPYYFPPDMAFAGRPLCPQDFAPRYESPCPPQPSNAAPPGMIAEQTRPVKVSSRAMDSRIRGIRDRDASDSSIITPYRPAPKHEAEGSRPAPIESRHQQREGASFASPGPERAVNPYVPATKPTQQSSSPGATPNQLSPAPPPAQYTGSHPSTHALQQLNVPAEQHLRSDQMPPVSGTPAQQPDFNPAPVDARARTPSIETQTQAESSSKKKGWTWGRTSPTANEQPHLAPHPVPRPGSQDL